MAWQMYPGKPHDTDRVPKYAAAVLETDYSGQSTCDIFVAEGELFYSETLAYVRRSRK